MEALSSSAVCRACRLRLQVKKLATSSTRTFATSSTKLYIPPESPTFVDIPQPHQPVRERKPPSKGLLPVPRELFPKSRPDKPSEKYLQNVTPNALPKNIPPVGAQTSVQKYKLRMAELRKANLREGLTALHTRKDTQEKRSLRRSILRSEQRERLVVQAEREDERLTANTVLSTMKPKELLDLPEGEEEALYEQRKARYEARQAAKREERRDKLHTLYMHARQFITTNEQLAHAIDVEFEKQSIWKLGLPSSLHQMISGKTPPEGKFDIGQASGLVAQSSKRFKTDQERMQRIAEKLSGGKM